MRSPSHAAATIRSSCWPICPKTSCGRSPPRLPEADAVIGGPTGQSIVPTAVGPTLLAAATNKGKFLVELDLRRRQMVRHCRRTG